MRTLTPHYEFRLFLTCDISPRLPAALLRLCEVVVAEASTGLKAGLQRFFHAIPPARADRAPAERGRLYGLLAWLHAVVQERTAARQAPRAVVRAAAALQRRDPRARLRVFAIAHAC